MHTECVCGCVGVCKRKEGKKEREGERKEKRERWIHFPSSPSNPSIILLSSLFWEEVNVNKFSHLFLSNLLGEHALVSLSLREKTLLRSWRLKSQGGDQKKRKLFWGSKYTRRICNSNLVGEIPILQKRKMTFNKLFPEFSSTQPADLIFKPLYSAAHVTSRFRAAFYLPPLPSWCLPRW